MKTKELLGLKWRSGILKSPEGRPERFQTLEEWDRRREMKRASQDRSRDDPKTIAITTDNGDTSYLAAS